MDKFRQYTSDKNYPKDEQDKLTPTSFNFLTNMAYGVNSVEPNAIERYVKYIEKLKSSGYIIQVSDAVNMHDTYFSSPTFMHLAIYVRK